MNTVIVDKPSEQISVIELHQPDRLNPMNFELVGDLYEAIEKVSADNETRVAILTGGGRGFCSGMDLDDAGMPPNIDGLPMSRIAIRAMEFMANLVPALRAMPQPVIAAVNGPAVGGGFCLAVGADIRLAGESASFRGAGIINGLTGTELGISYLLPRLIGASRANEVLLTGRRVSAEEAERIGLVSRIVADDKLMETTLGLAEQMCELSAHGLSMTKRVLWANLEAGSLGAAIDLENRSQLLVRMTTSNLDEFLAARREGRQPVYED
ncbi:MAG: enoyl-CoA hydratase-related protein [Candidatus Binatia bacterium]